MLRNVLGKTLGFVGYTVQYGCIAHCAFEYIGEVVVVCIILIIIQYSYFPQSILIHPCIRNNCMFFVALLQCSGPSMEPTIVNHDIVFSERMSRHLYKIQK